MENKTLVDGTENGQKKQVMALIDRISKDIMGWEYSYKNAPQYLAKFEENMVGCSISETHLNVTLDPKFFTENYPIVKDIFPSTAWRLRNHSFRNCYIHSGSYSIELLGHSGSFGGIVRQDGEFISITDGDPRASFGSDYDWPKSNGTSTTAGREFMELVRKENMSAISREVENLTVAVKERLKSKD
ncbi:Uncharacterised protein [uncultured archaeon]|nr:Uncharacterised protein [uncultured archaeon]